MRLLKKAPKPIWLLELENTHSRPEPVWKELLLQMDSKLVPCWFRGVTVEKLPITLQSGIDVEPTTAPIFAAPRFGKALEYGGWPKIVLALDPKALKNTHREVPADTSAAELAALARDYPTQLTTEDGKWHWFSRLPKEDTRLAKAYEVDYARWIEGNPMDALVALLICATPSDGDAVVDLCEILDV